MFQTRKPRSEAVLQADGVQAVLGGIGTGGIGRSTKRRLVGNERDDRCLGETGFDLAADAQPVKFRRGNINEYRLWFMLTDLLVPCYAQAHNCLEEEIMDDVKRGLADARLQDPLRVAFQIATLFNT